MQRIIITPTFRPHFGFNREFLRSYADRASDAADVPVHFVVSAGEVAELRTVLEEFDGLDLHVHAVEDLLARAGHQVEAGDLLEEVGKFAFQALKKLYALSVLDYDQALILDSESVLLRPTHVSDLFEEYFADPVVYFSDLEHRTDSWYGSLSDTVTGNAARLLGTAYPRMYLLEYYGWFYDKRLVTALFEAIGGDLLGAVRQLGREKAIFESILYYVFLTTQPDSAGYRFVSVNDLLREHLGQDRYDRYIRNFHGRWEAFGIFEYLSKEVTDDNIEALLRLFGTQRLRFYRSELLNGNAQAQDRLLEGSGVVVLASSEHFRRMHQRVAVCLSGQARNYRQNVRFLRTFLRDSGADLFMHMWETPDEDFIVRALQPTAYTFEDQQAFLVGPDFVDVRPLALRRERFAPDARDVGSACMFYGIHQANALKRNHEREHGRYDVVVRVRLDVLSLDTLNDVLDRISAAQQGLENTVYVPDMAQSVGLNDQVAAGSSESMDAYSSAYQHLADFAVMNYFNPEYFLLEHVLSRGLTIRTFPLEYLLLRDETVTLLKLDEHIARTKETWWSAPMPPVRPALLMDHFRAKARSVALVAELGVETPRLFRLRAPDGMLLTLDAASQSLRFQGREGEAGTRFYLVVHDDQDRTAVDLRCADLSLSADGRGWTAVAEADGRLRPDGSPGRRSALYLGGTPDALTLEWRAGFWQGLDRREDGRKGVSAHASRLFVGVEDGRPALRWPHAGADVFRLEHIDDPAVEHVPLGMVAGVSRGQVRAGEGRLVVLTWKLLEGARVYDEHGLGEFVNRTAVLARRTLRTGDGAGRAALLADRALAALQRRS